MPKLPKFGYRDDELFGDHITNPIDVAIYETTELGNIDIPRMLITSYENQLTNEQKCTLQQICEYHNQGFDATEDDLRILEEALLQVLNGRNFCLWLCKYPSYIYDAYIEPYSDSDLRLNEGFCSTYQIPEDAIALTDTDDTDGTLYAWFATVANTQPVSIQTLREAIEKERKTS